jgi:hypothetical protein
MLDEIMQSMKAHLYDRAVSPLMGSFIVSWAVWNYKFILIFMSGLDATEKFKIIDTLLFPTWTQVALQGSIYPLITALAYLYIYPHPAKKVFEYSRGQQKDISDIKKKIERESLLTVNESRAIRGEIYKLEESLQKEIGRKDGEIQRLKMEIDSISTQPNKKINSAEDILSSPDEKKSTENIDLLGDDQVALLQIIGSYTDAVEEIHIIESYNGGHVKAKYYLGELEKLGYVTRDYEQGLGDYTYELSHKARSFLVNHEHV